MFAEGEGQRIEEHEGEGCQEVLQRVHPGIGQSFRDEERHQHNQEDEYAVGHGAQHLGVDVRGLEEVHSSEREVPAVPIVHPGRWQVPVELVDFPGGVETIGADVAFHGEEIAVEAGVAPGGVEVDFGVLGDWHGGEISAAVERERGLEAQSVGGQRGLRRQGDGDADAAGEGRGARVDAWLDFVLRAVHFDLEVGEPDHVAEAEIELRLVQGCRPLLGNGQFLGEDALDNDLRTVEHDLVDAAVADLRGHGCADFKRVRHNEKQRVLGVVPHAAVLVLLAALLRQRNSQQRSDEFLLVAPFGGDLAFHAACQPLPMFGQALYHQHRNLADQQNGAHEKQLHEERGAQLLVQRPEQAHRIVNHFFVVHRSSLEGQFSFLVFRYLSGWRHTRPATSGFPR